MVMTTSCAFDPKSLTPNFVDTQHQTCREYKVTETSPKIVFVFDKEYPISHCDGFFALPVAQALEVKRAYEKSLHAKNPAVEVEPLTDLSPGSIVNEIKLLGGVSDPNIGAKQKESTDNGNN
jgi:hypothetical protein